MIGSHNTFTYLEPTCKIFNLFKRYWRSQEVDLSIQYDEYDVKFFDIRVFKNKHSRWQACHGMVNLNFQMDTLKDYCTYIENNYPLAKYRIIIEKNYNSEQLDRAHAKLLCDRFENLINISYKSSISDIVEIIHSNHIRDTFKIPLWKSPHIEINGGYHYRNGLGIFKNLWNFLKHNIKKNMLSIIEGKLFKTKNNIENENYVILSDYVNLLK